MSAEVGGREYRVVWKRQGLDRKSKRYARRATADHLAALIRAETAEEVLRLRGVDPEEEHCCNGYQCGCAAETNLERERAYRAELPPVEFCRIEEREVGAWREVGS